MDGIWRSKTGSRQGTTFAVYVNDIVMAYAKAESVQTDGTTTYITSPDADDGAVLNADQQGELDVDMTEFIPADEETYVIMVLQSQKV